MKKQYISFLMATLAVVMLVGAAMAGNSNESAKRKWLTTTWYYTGTTLSGVNDTANWTQTNPNFEDCGISTQMPCSMTVDASDRPALQDILEGKTNAEINNLADEWRPEQ